jgi:hypothetical protein
MKNGKCRCAGINNKSDVYSTFAGTFVTYISWPIWVWPVCITRPFNRFRAGARCTVAAVLTHSLTLCYTDKGSPIKKMRKFIQNCSYPLQINKNQPLTNINCYILYKNHVYNTLCIKYLLVQGKVKMTIKTSFGLKKLPQARFVNLFSKRRYPINVAKILQTFSYLQYVHPYSRSVYK